jgi:hypothetical protein
LYGCRMILEDNREYQIPFPQITQISADFNPRTST